MEWFCTDGLLASTLYVGTHAIYQNSRCLWGNHDHLGRGVEYICIYPCCIRRAGLFVFQSFFFGFRHCILETAKQLLTLGIFWNKEREKKKTKHNLLSNCEMRHATKTADCDYLSKLQRNSLHMDSTSRQSGWLRPGVPARFSYLKLILICRVLSSQTRVCGEREKRRKGYSPICIAVGSLFSETDNLFTAKTLSFTKELNWREGWEKGFKETERFIPVPIEKGAESWETNNSRTTNCKGTPRCTHTI